LETLRVSQKRKKWKENLGPSSNKFLSFKRKVFVFLELKVPKFETLWFQIPQKKKNYKSKVLQKTFWQEYIILGFPHPFLFSLSAIQYPLAKVQKDNLLGAYLPNLIPNLLCNFS